MLHKEYDMWRMISVCVPAFVVMFWNVENYFDPFDDPAKNDDEFTAASIRAWTWPRFEKKRDGLAKTIVAAGDVFGELPTVIGLAEVENKMVIRQLCRNTLLAELDYDFIHRESPDARGIDVALLYRKSHFRILAVDSLRVSGFDTRDILYVCGVRQNDRDLLRQNDSGQPYQSKSLVSSYSSDLSNGTRSDTLHIFVCHWPSKRGGARKSQPHRDSVAAMLSAACLKVDSRTAQIIIMGDFNDGMKDYDATYPYCYHCIPSGVFPSETEGISGTLKYHGLWETIDHFFLPHSATSPEDTCLRDADSPADSYEVRIFAPSFLLEPDRSYLGFKPRRTYLGPRYNYGLSDHLPIVLQVK